MSTKTNLIILIISFLFFFIITIGVVKQSEIIQNFDNQTAYLISNIHFPTLDKMMISITKICNTYESLLIFIVFAILLIVKRKKTSFYILTIATALGTILPEIIKNLVGRIRPESLLLQETGFSFPSGHATISVIFLISSIILLAPIIKNRLYKIIFIIITTTIFSLVAFSRIYLSVHFASDVIAGIFLGISCFTLPSLIVAIKSKICYK
ncbi:MAG: phosphatase PAP2 family protein [Candidatus Taylorbacteria bacterium]|nr:phosphatase PAP2 family protein [Candidatus Taylorbacteria bacterium]